MCLDNTSNYILLYFVIQKDKLYSVGLHLLSNIRVTHSGLVNLLTGLARVVAAFVFITLVTRSLSVEEFGQYNLVLSITVYVVTSHWIISYWTTREIARGNTSGKTAILSSGIFSSIGTFIFLIIGMSVSNSSNLELNTIILAGALIPLQFLHNILNHISVGWRPQIASYGNLFLELAKVPLAFLFLFMFGMELNGVFLSLILGFLASISIMLYFNRNQLRVGFSLTILKTWLSRFWLPGYQMLATIIYTFDFLIVVILASPEVVGFYAAILAIGSLVSHSNLVTVGAYPKLLGNGRGKYLNENFRLLLYFSILFSTLSIVFAKAGLFILNPIYEVVSVGVIFITIRYFLFNISYNFNSMLRATETIDEKQNPTIGEFLKSKLFKIPTIQLFQYVSYILILTVSLLLIKSPSSSDLVIFWSIISLLAQIPNTLLICIWMKKEKLIQINFITILKYFVAAVPIYFFNDFLTNIFLDYNANIFILVPQILLILSICILSYVGITFLIDGNTRQLLKSIVNELKK